MKTLEQKPKSNKAKRFERKYGRQDHGTRGTDRRRFARLVAKNSVELDPYYADDPAKQEKVYQSDRLWAIKDLGFDTFHDKRSKDQVSKQKEAAVQEKLSSGEEDYSSPDTHNDGVVQTESLDEFQDMVHGTDRAYEEAKEDEAYDMNAKVDSVYQGERVSQNGTHRKRNRNLVRQVEKLVEGNEVSDDK